MKLIPTNTRHRSEKNKKQKNKKQKTERKKKPTHTQSGKSLGPHDSLNIEPRCNTNLTNFQDR